MTNPWTLGRLRRYEGHEEGVCLDFKSSKPLSTGDKSAARKYFDDLSSHVSAFLNGEGGTLILGLEEGNRKNQPDIATELSPGVPRKLLTAQQVENYICDRIHPSVAAYVHVFPITIDEIDGEKLLAFAVEIGKGMTAYQAADKLYYVRRSYSSEPMDDKDIRLRMLSDDRPRASLSVRVTGDKAIETYRKRLINYEENISALEKELGQPYDEISIENKLSKAPPNPTTWGEDRSEIQITLAIHNSGSRTIRECFVVWKVVNAKGVSVYDAPIGIEVGNSKSAHFLYGAELDSPSPLFPAMERDLLNISVRRTQEVDPASIELTLTASIYLDNGPANEHTWELGSELCAEFHRSGACLEHIKQYREMPE